MNKHLIGYICLALFTVALILLGFFYHLSMEWIVLGLLAECLLTFLLLWFFSRKGGES